ncbi:choice-of-anchor G family protein [Microbacterium esteraromaticum]|uniref:choice-of-anchor G family protein n=1 Tax=Microbacterium esteraromaticum TaxID=57043 RepID=UPI00195CE397|nr:choice-of-anchor G family protein [Microbacterium esteraromaticum]MBM7466706.1 hypothetical protein [Microbacterium esteraromaticum]
MVATAAPAYALSCIEGNWAAIGRGKMLSGGLFNIDLDTLASVDGTIASAPTLVAETGFVHGPNAEGDPDKHANPLSVTALGTINVTATGLTTTVSQLLGLVASAPDGTGLLNQFGFAQSNGLSMGASGYVDDNGTIRVAPAGGYPQVASLDLKQFLTPLLGSATTGFLANVTNLKLDVGALVGRAVLEQMCNTVVNPQGYRLTREYLVAYLRLVLTSPLVGSIVTAVTSAVNTANLSVDSAALLTALGQIPLLGPVVSALVAAAAQPTVKISANVGQVITALTSSPIGSGTAIITDLGGGTVTIDVASLLGSAFPGGASAMANSLPANSVLFVDYPLPTNVLADQLSQMQNEIITRIAGFVSVEISYSIAGGLTTLRVSGTLADLLNGNATITATLLGSSVVNGPITNAALVTVGNIVRGGLLATGGVINVALVALNNLLATIFDALKNLLNITLNVQNLPQANNNPSMPDNGPGPARWSSGAQALPTGRFDVAALGITAVAALPVPSVLDLFLARGSVGPHTAA